MCSIVLPNASTIEYYAICLLNWLNQYHSFFISLLELILFFDSTWLYSIFWFKLIYLITLTELETIPPFISIFKVSESYLMKLELTQNTRGWYIPIFLIVFFLTPDDPIWRFRPNLSYCHYCQPLAWRLLICICYVILRKTPSLMIIGMWNIQLSYI